MRFEPRGCHVLVVNDSVFLKKIILLTLIESYVTDIESLLGKKKERRETIKSYRFF